jgi:predicted nucleotidyltransferase component of viral defense system
LSEPQSGARSQEIYRALQRQARKEGRTTQELFEFYLLERFLYRLSISEYCDHFVLKGGLLLTAVGTRRPTRDVDVLARNIKGDEESLLSVVKEIAAISMEDGLSFDASSARTTMIREQEVHPGTRIVIPPTLSTARLQSRLDINVGDPVHPRQITYPTVLSDEPFTLLGYPVETVVAEKVDTMITRGDANTRERDYADVLMLSKTHALKTRALRKALEGTAAYRGTELLPLTDALDTLPTARQASWRAFVDRTGLTDALPYSFEQAVLQVSEFVDPILRNDQGLDRWNPSARAWT